MTFALSWRIPMGFLAAIGGFGVGALVMVWAFKEGLIASEVAANLAVGFIVAGIVFPFYSAYQGKRAASSDVKDGDAMEKSVRALAEATKALETAKKQ
jgi:hypothetical protein